MNILKKYPLAVLLISCAFVIFGALILLVPSDVQQRKSSISSPAEPPAPLSELKTGYYLVDSSSVEEYPNRTNFLATLREVDVMFTENDALPAGTSRLYMVDRLLEVGGIYLITRVGTNTLYEPIPPKEPR